MPNPDMKFSLQPRWKFFLAWMLGTKTQEVNVYDQTLLIGYRWGGVLYIKKIEPLCERNNHGND